MNTLIVIYICPNNAVLKYSTTNRDWYKEYKSCSETCSNCPYISQCTESKDHVKLVTRHIWEDYIEKCEDIRLSIGMKELYSHRKETIERLFGTAKENHGFRYTQMIGKARMEMKAGLTFACMNLKKSARMLEKYREVSGDYPHNICKKQHKILKGIKLFKIQRKVALGFVS